MGGRQFFSLDQYWTPEHELTWHDMIRIDVKHADNNYYIRPCKCCYIPITVPVVVSISRSCNINVCNIVWTYWSLVLSLQSWMNTIACSWLTLKYRSSLQVGLLGLMGSQPGLELGLVLSTWGEWRLFTPAPETSTTEDRTLISLISK